MTAASYNECLRRLLTHEGGYTNDRADPGGPTNFGITIADYRMYVKPGASERDVKAMRLEEAKFIYHAKYWNALGCDDLPPGVDDSIFDYGVNSGVGRASKVLRRVIGLPDTTGVADVLAAVGRRDPKALIIAINGERLRFLKSLKTWPVFGKGWGRRVAEVQAFDLALAAYPTGSPPPRPAITSPSVPAGKGVVPKPVVATAAGPIAGGLVGGSLFPFFQAHPVLVLGGIVLIVAAVIAILARVTKRHTAQQEAPTPGLAVVPQSIGA